MPRRKQVLQNAIAHSFVVKIDMQLVLTQFHELQSPSSVIWDAQSTALKLEDRNEVGSCKPQQASADQIRLNLGQLTRIYE